MAKSNNQKAKILFLERMLRETGENHVVSMQEILDSLAARGIAAERKSIYDDLDALRAYGMDVRFRRGKPGGYYVAGQTEPASEKKAEIPTAETKAEKAASAGFAWTFEGKYRADEKKQMTLLGDRSREPEIRAYFEGHAAISTENPQQLVVEAPVSTDPQFFGWLAAMGTDVYLKKPKKLAQIYREYLKSLAREYKNVGKKED